tara:strand:- start:258 stop:614 length:357 start_codon:yes stop_codon:yes gene_type:complete
MTEEKEYWSLEDLAALTEAVQETEIEHQGKYLKVQWCELVESEEPKFEFNEEATEEEKQQMYIEMGKARCMTMLEKALKKNPDFEGLTPNVWEKIPSTLKYKIQNTMMGVDVADFQNG